MAQYKTYAEKLKDPRWQKKRLEILSRDEFTCRLCQCTKHTLHVHHEEYVKGRQPWEYDDYMLTTLCEHCHFMVEFVNKNFPGMWMFNEVIRNDVSISGIESMVIHGWDLMETGVYCNHVFALDTVGNKGIFYINTLDEINEMTRRLEYQDKQWEAKNG